MAVEIVRASESGQSQTATDACGDCLLYNPTDRCCQLLNNQPRGTNRNPLIRFPSGVELAQLISSARGLLTPTGISSMIETVERGWRKAGGNPSDQEPDLDRCFITPLNCS